MGTLIIANRSGHDEQKWSAAEKESIVAASKRFEEQLAKGYFAAAYHGDSTNSENGKIIKAFDETADEIKMFPNLVGG